MTEMTWIWIAAAVVVVVLLGLAAWVVLRARRRRHLKSHFGPEYRHTVEETGSRNKAESELRQREKRVEKYELRTLSASERDRFAQHWRSVQATFVDDPSAAVTEADAVIRELLETRGFPVGDFEQRQADLSVRHPEVVHHYREAREIAARNRRADATTEDLRQAMKHYRTLFDSVLTDQDQPKSEVA